MFAIETLKTLNETDESISRRKRLKALTELATDLAKIDLKLLAEPEETTVYQDLVDTGLAWCLDPEYRKNIEIAITKGLVRETFEETHGAD